MSLTLYFGQNDDKVNSSTENVESKTLDSSWMTLKEVRFGSRCQLNGVYSFMDVTVMCRILTIYYKGQS